MREFLFPNSVAVVGASPKAESIGGQTFLQLLKNYGGKVYAVNPKYKKESVAGREVEFFPSLSYLPEVPDLLVVATPAEAAPQVVEEDPARNGPAAAAGEEADFEVETIIGARRKGKYRQYRVVWRGWPVEQAS